MKEASFEHTWNIIQESLKPGMVIDNWTYRRGYLGDQMKVVGVSTEIIVIESPNARKQIRVPKEDFQVVFAIWQEYNSGKVTRRQICDKTFYSKYIISIFHWATQFFDE